MTDRSTEAEVRLDGAIALVTGGAGHIGRVIVQKLAGLGAATCVVDIDASANDFAAEVEELHGVPSCGVDVDLGEDTGPLDAVQACRSRLGGLSIVVNCAAFVGTTSLDGWATSFERQSGDAWDAAMRLNVGVAFRLAQQAWPFLRGSAGSIVNVSSVYGRLGPSPELYAGTEMHNPAAYGASKAALEQLTRWLASELAPHVRVNAVAPGGIFRDQDPAFVRRYVERTPAGRMGEEDDVAGAVAFLASNWARYVTGHTLVVDGGYSIR